ncbi:hypothetical protein GE061_009033 [Apolygus lucorum]|uniref:Uncharacterized protein n=1 Tax=Apolygus lucorum TaxID=248454 RepID=A0A8S9XZE8_APOLU|nr:hypothetical protein GE061_009033 [Apolygus lucorum]
MSRSSAFWTCVPIPGASGDHGNNGPETSSSNDIYCPDTISGLIVDGQLSGNLSKLPITTEGVSVALPRSYGSSQGSPPRILAAGGSPEPGKDDNPPTSDGRNRGPPATSGQTMGQTGQDGDAPRRSFYEFLPLLIFAIGTVTILRVAALRGK